MFQDFFLTLLVRIESIRDEEGQTAIEYGLVLALIAVGIVVAMKLGLAGVASDVATKVTNAVTSAS
jgi:Flp pilus assembly pilin Flp